MSHQRQRWSLLAAGLLSAACGGRSGGGSVPVVITDMAVATSAGSVVAAELSFRSAGVSRGRAVCRTPGEEDVVTPFEPLRDGDNTIPILGLIADTEYTVTLETESAGGARASTPMPLRTGKLPDFLRDRVFFLTVGDASPGFHLTGIIGRDELRNYTMAFDGLGRIRWYQMIPDRGTLVKQLDDGNIVVYVGNNSGHEMVYGHFLEITPLGETVGRYEAPAPDFTDNHDLVVTDGPNGRKVHFFSYNHRKVDLRRFGGPAEAEIAGHQLLRLDAAGNVEFRFDAWDAFELDDWVEAPLINRLLGIGDFDHPNSLVFDLDGNYIVSWRAMAQVTKINSQTGEVMWRLGGRMNEFRIEGDPLGAFYGQHTARILDNGHLLLYDNGNRHMPQESRAVEYELDVDARVARMVWEYRHDPSLYTPFVGSAQRLLNGNTLVGFGLLGVGSEVDANGSVLWEVLCSVDGLPQPFYRLEKVRSLYEHLPP